MTRSMEFNNPRVADVNLKESRRREESDHHLYKKEYWVYNTPPIEITGGKKQPSESHIATLNRTIHELSKVIDELKEQLTQHIKLNEALESDLDRAESAIKESAEEREMLMKRIHALAGEKRLYEESRRDLEQITRERDTLAEKVHDLGKMLAISEQRVLETGKLIDRFRNERNDATGEINCLDSQFARAMKVIEELRHELSDTKNENEALTSRLDFAERQKQVLTSQRDALKEEIADTRNALEEIRRNILDASLGIENEAGQP